uniref:Butyrophilin subfamily 1 member A1 n=1 Tax=Suricata suricatta TaxID=37032 RepID=A0A673TUF7_SURSU
SLFDIISGFQRCENFVVFGPSDPIVAVLGGNIMLSCRVSPAMDVETMELRWFRSKFSEVVFIYENQQEQKEGQLEQYTGRTSLVKDFLSRGEAAVLIQKVQASDNGMYTCFFRKGSFYEEANLELKVAGVGSAPQVRITGPEEDGVQVVCMTSGWFPKPQVQWRAVNGEKFLSFSETYTEDAEGLFSVEAALVVRDSSSRNITCSVLNPVLDQKKTMAIFIPEPFFPQASPWKSAFIVSLMVLMLPLIGATYYTKREHTAKRQAQQEWETLMCPFSGWKKAQLYAVSVTLDPESAHPSLAVSGGKTSVTLKDTSEDPAEPCSIVGQEAITSGCSYWEVEIRNGNRSNWNLGVCRGDAERQGWYREGPEKGFWVVGKYEHNFCALVLPNDQVICEEIPQRVGVFIDLEEGDVSFYNMTKNSHLFSFSLPSSSGTLIQTFKNEDLLWFPEMRRHRTGSGRRKSQIPVPACDQ